MPKFTAASKANLEQAHPELQRLFNEVIKVTNCRVLDAQRGKAAQELAFSKGHSKAHFGSSPHNYVPAVALDVVPTPLDWNDLASFRALGKVVKAKATELKIPISWGGDWKSFKDYPHYELTPWRTWAKGSTLVGTTPTKTTPVPVAKPPAVEGTKTMATHTAKDIQKALAALKYDVGEIDGQIGPKTSAALKAFQKAKKLTESGTADAATLKALFPSTSPVPRTLKASFIDYIIGGVTSKINWAAAALVAIGVTWINTRFGFEVPAEIQNLVTGAIITIGGLLIGALRTWFNSPHVATNQPGVVTQPSKVK